ncbi:MAG: outer membrane beta-barrel protein [Prevotella sp.]|nr:outer membrane beta-barrel protein [Prevotella sp.]
MMARGASFDVDAVYSNPAGLVWSEHDGWQLSFNAQKPFQYRDIEATLSQPYATAIGFEQHKFKGKASANPFVPALFATYKHDNWAVGFMAGIVGSGGKCTYDDGVPQFAVPVRGMMGQVASGINAGAGAAVVPADFYRLDAFMEGKQYIYGIQANFAYRFNDHWSASVGLRANIYDGYNRGHVIATTDNAIVSGAMGGTGELLRLNLDVDQRGWGLCPFLSVNYKYDRLVLTGRYEFRSKLNIPNDTKTLEIGAAPALQAQPAFASAATLAAPYQDGVKTRYDMPSLLSLAVGYELTDQLRATAEYHFFDDKHAKMSGNRQDELEHGTHEFLLGVEYDINDRLTVSCGAQRTDYGLSDNYQANTSFACDSYSIGLGAAYRLTEQLRINAGYFCSLYSDYSREANYLSIPVTETYSRTNNVFGLGIDYRF